MDIRARLRGVAMITKVPVVIVVNNDDPSQDLEDVIAAAIKENAEGFQCGSGPTGATPHIIGGLFNNRIGADVLHIP